ncbi:MAG: hypothetical protein ACRC0E_01475 [Soonwooa sp.]
MYRNKTDLTSHEGIFVEAGSLWQKRGELMILEDEDQFVSAPFDEKIFISVSK